MATSTSAKFLNIGPHMRGIAEFDPSAFFNVSSIAPAGDGMNELVKFMADNRADRVRQDGTVARSMYVGSENPDSIETMPTQTVGLAIEELSYINRIVLPLKFTSILTFRWNVVEFLPDMLTLNPELGTNRAGERIEHAFTSHSRRVGQHFEIEDDCFRGSMGAQEVEYGMMRFAKAIAEYAVWMAWGAIVQPNPLMRLSVQDVDGDRHRYLQHLQTIKNSFAQPYKSNKGFYVGFQTYNAHMMRRCNSLPNVLIMPRTKTALITNGTNLTDHQHGGERGTQMLMSNGYVTSVDQCAVYEPPTFVLNPKLNDVSPLNTQVRVCEYHVHEFVTKEVNGVEKYEHKDKLYDVNRDKWAKVDSLEDMMRASGRFEYEPNGAFAGVHKYPASRTDPSDPFYSFYLNAEPEFVKTFSVNGKPLNANNTDIEDWKEFVVKYCDVATVAPFDGCNMQSEVYIAANANAGITTMSPPVIQHGFDAGVMKHVFNMILHAGCHIWDYSRFLVRNNVYYDGILGGGGLDLISQEEAQKLKRQGFRDDRIDRPSLYVMIVTKNAKWGATHIDLRGPDQFAPEDSETYPCSKFYSDLYGWNSANLNLENPYVSPIALIGYRRAYNRLNRDCSKYEFEPGESLHGPIVGVGSRLMRETGTFVADVITSTGI